MRFAAALPALLLPVAAAASTWFLAPDGPDVWTISNAATLAVRRSKDPIADVYGADRCSTASRNRQPLKCPGDVIELAPGEYPHSRITLTYDVNPGVPHGLKNNDRIRKDQVTWGRDPMTVIRAATPGTVTFRRNPVGGSQTLYLEWAGALRLEGLTFLASAPMALATENPKPGQGEWQGFRDIELVNCSVRGGRDFESARGPADVRWGLLSYALGRSARGDDTPGFRWSGGATPNRPDDWDIEGLHQEHAMYHHNAIANRPEAFAMLVENLRIRWCGRTAFQMVARRSEGPDGSGRIVLRNLEIEDVCLESGGGGSALTFAGNHDGEVRIENVRVRLGANPRLHGDYARNITGALVAHAGEGSQGRPTRAIVVTNCFFQVGPAFVGEGSARRPNVHVSAVRSFRLLHTVVLSHRGSAAALRIEPDSVDEAVLDTNNRVIGDCAWGKQTFPDPSRDGSGYRAMLAALKDDPRVRLVTIAPPPDPELSSPGRHAHGLDEPPHTPPGRGWRRSDTGATKAGALPWRRNPFGANRRRGRGPHNGSRGRSPSSAPPQSWRARLRRAAPRTSDRASGRHRTVTSRLTARRAFRIVPAMTRPTAPHA